VGQARELVIATLQLLIKAIAEGNTLFGAAILDHVTPESHTTPPQPSPAASASPWACSTTGSPASTREHRKIALAAAW
jgi:hypothetical protein